MVLYSGLKTEEYPCSKPTSFLATCEENTMQAITNIILSIFRKKRTLVKKEEEN